MRLVKLFCAVSVGLYSTVSFAQSSVIPLKTISSANLVSLNRLSFSRLPIHKNISCWQTYQQGKHVYTDCSDSQGYQSFSKYVDYGWNKSKSSCSVAIEERNARVESNTGDVGLFKLMAGSLFESDIKLAAGQSLSISGNDTESNESVIQLKAISADGKKVYVRCLDPNATNADLDYDLAGVVTLRQIQEKAPELPPVAAPSAVPSEAPSAEPSVQPAPESVPSAEPSLSPSPEPAPYLPQIQPSSGPTVDPSAVSAN